MNAEQLLEHFRGNLASLSFSIKSDLWEREGLGRFWSTISEHSIKGTVSYVRI
jgi:hypothetical protein